MRVFESDHIAFELEMAARRLHSSDAQSDAVGACT
jgi:hypothetical protein